jgi:hypothetical protein
MSSISIENYVDDVLANATSVKLKDVGNTFGIRNADTLAVIVTPTGDIAPTTTGTYSYDIGAIALSGQYEAQWEVINGSSTSYVQQLFEIEAAEVMLPGPSLAEIEAETARRIGPYFSLVAGSGATVERVPVPTLQSRLLRSGYDDLYILRRGRTTSGSAVPGFIADDRVRVVKELDVSTGALVVDRNYTGAPIQNEVIELMALDPVAIRSAVLEGLRRAYFIDTVTLTPDAGNIESDFTALAPWLKDTWQVMTIDSGWDTPFAVPTKVGWWKPIARQGRLHIRSGAFHAGRAIVTALRPAHTLVNGSTTLAGPNDDDDYVHISKEYAASAAHVECWRYYPAQLTPLAQLDMGISKTDAAKVFTKEGELVISHVPQYNQPPGPFGVYTGQSNAS